MIALLLLLFLVLLGCLLAALFLLGFRLGGGQAESQVARVHREAARAERQIHDLTRQAFVSMAEAAERSRTNRQP
jgi:uncharacterized membrane protein YciS (DUF1049 family)